MMPHRRLLVGLMRVSLSQLGRSSCRVHDRAADCNGKVSPAPPLPPVIGVRQCSKGFVSKMDRATVWALLRRSSTEQLWTRQPPARLGKQDSRSTRKGPRVQLRRGRPRPRKWTCPSPGARLGKRRERFGFKRGPAHSTRIAKQKPTGRSHVDLP